jgi:hypothetical protein
LTSSLRCGCHRSFPRGIARHKQDFWGAIACVAPIGEKKGGRESTRYRRDLDNSMSDRKTAAPPPSADDDDDDCECIESGVEVTVIRCSDGKKNQVTTSDCMRHF